MQLKKPYIAALDQVRISRQGDYGIVEYIEPNVTSVKLKIGPQILKMSNQEILDEHNKILRIQQQNLAESENLAFEIPEGHPQIEYSKQDGQWSPRGEVLRCVIGDGGTDGEATVFIDDKELSLASFGKLLSTFTGWGMRIAFVPEEFLNEEPNIVVQDPDLEK
jgi:hypothetical protein